MAIVDIQRRLHEAGRIRIGAQVPVASGPHRGKLRPAKLETFRLTSRVRRYLEAVADLYGGEVRPWTDGHGGEQFEVVTNASELRVVVPPEAMAWSQWYELWQGGGCVRRCDGEYQVPTGAPCVCDPDQRECQVTSRLSVLLVGCPTTGLWRIETHGYYAGVELGGAVQTASLLVRLSGRPLLPARLRLDQRTIRRLGQPPRHFAVPLLEFDVDMGQLAAAPALAAVPEDLPLQALPAGEKAAPSAVTPVPRRAPSVAAQLAAIEDRPAPARRRGVSLPPTGRRPRTAAEAEASAQATVASSGPDATSAAPASRSGRRRAARAESAGVDPALVEAEVARIDQLLRAQGNAEAVRLEAELSQRFAPAEERSPEQWLQAREWLEAQAGSQGARPEGAQQPELGQDADGAPEVPAAGPDAPPASDEGGDTPRWCADLHRRATSLGVSADQLHAAVAYVTNSRTVSTRNLRPREAVLVNNLLTEVDAGNAAFTQDGAGWRVVFR